MKINKSGWGTSWEKVWNISEGPQSRLKQMEKYHLFLVTQNYQDMSAV